MTPLPDQGVMLARTPSDLGTTLDGALRISLEEGRYFEIKWDGVRCLAHVGDEVILRNRNGRKINDRYPDVVEALRQQVAPGTVLDGEIVAFDGEGLPSFSLISRRDRVGSLRAATKAMRLIPATFTIFDVLMDRGHDLRDAPYEGRRLVLQAIGAELGDHLRTSPGALDGQTMWQFIDERGMEGLIAKAPLGNYRAGRQGTWLKLKRIVSDSFAVTGFVPGKGKHEGLVGALLLAQYDADGTLVQRGKVGTGFSDAMRRHLLTYFDDAGRPHGGEPPVVEVEFSSITDDGSLRFPSFKGMRTDVSHEQCKIAHIAHTGGTP